MTSSLMGACRGGLSDPAGAPQQGAEAGEEFAGRKGLRQVVVGTEFEADDAVHLLATAGEHHDGHFGLRADAAEDLKAIAARHHDIEDDRRPRLRSGTLSSMLAIVLHFDPEAHGLEVIGHELAELGVVVDDEEAHGPKMKAFSPAAIALTQS